MSATTILRKLQYEEISALKSFIAFCESHGLHYYLRGGSVLGAVKYHGMIPWDDDIDVVLPRADYDRLIKIAPCEIGETRFEHFTRNKELNCYFARLYLKEENRKQLGIPKNNAFGLVLIDILPIDGIPNNRLMFMILEFRVNVLRLLSSVHTLDHKDTVVKRKGIRKIIPELLNKLRVHKLYKQVDIYKRLEEVYSKWDFDKAKNIGVLAGSKSSRETFPKAWLGNGIAYDFESVRVNIPERFDEYLQLLFGIDYMEREPKESERIQKHFEGGL